MQQTTKNIILTGYRATGKSCIGKLLAERLGLGFIDMDKEIEAREKSSIADIVEKHGWQYFRSHEKELLTELISKIDLVIATGGGAILHADIWKEAMQSAFVVWLKADLETIKKRIRDDSNTDAQRPSLTGNSVTKEIEAVLKEREPLYSTGSHISVDTTNNTPDDIVEIILKSFKKI